MKKKRLYILGTVTLLIQVIAYKLISQKPHFIENYIVPYVFSPIARSLRFLTSPFPFSIGLVLNILMVIALIYHLIKQVVLISKKRRTLSDFALSSLAWLSPIYFFYMILWGFLYYRLPVSALLNYDTAPVSAQELKELCEDLVQSTNASREELTQIEIDTATFKWMKEEAIKGYSTQPNFTYKTPSVKQATGSALLAYMGTAGVYTFFSGEANVNTILANHDVPEVTLHEMAHQLGYASEDEANYIAWLAGKDHPEKLFRYSANYNVVWRSLNRLWNVDSTAANQLYHQLDSTVYHDSEIAMARWKPYRNLVQDYVISPFYNFFLKANGQEYGSMSYDMVVDLLIYERRKSLGSPKHP
jgi:hypothetical protein